ncbi:MAG: hypothetical protein R3E50_01345 [Halioglobus sp.]
MTAARLIEYRITRQLLRHRDECARGEPGHPAGWVLPGDDPQHINAWVDRLIAILAATVGLLVVGTYLEELVWVLLTAATLLTLR